ncbi:MAG TPA: VIT domain-containing protein [Nannocystaceae bacterium]|nr:VIT domain-containing protein [Nannocystaceae bacterium]
MGCAPHARILDHTPEEPDVVTPVDEGETPERADTPVPIVDVHELAAPDDHCERIAAADEPLSIDPDAPNSGALMTMHRGEIVGMPLADTTFATNVTATIASTTVTQTFVNAFDRPIEALYTFPLPHDAAVDSYAFRFAGREIKGVIKRRAEAVADYAKAKATGKTAALLEQERPNVFTQSLANLPPGARIDVEIHLVQPLAPTRGRYELALPTVVAPRYTKNTSDVARLSAPVLSTDRRTCGDLHITVAFDGGSLVDDVRSEAHRVRTTTKARSTVVELDEDFALLNRDFVLSWSRGGTGPHATMLTEARDGERWFSLTIEPPDLVDEADAPARELIFVLDASGSMSGEPIALAKATMAKFLHGLRKGDAFQVVRFSDRASGLGETLVPASDENVARALEYVEGLESEGGTEMTAGIQAALGFPHDEDRVRFVVFLTDGFIGDEARVFELVEREIDDARLFSVGIGASVNRYLLDGMARVGRGDVAYANLEEDPTPIVERLYTQLDRPAITDLAVDFGKTKVEAVVPTRIPDLLADRPVVLFGRMRGAAHGDVLVHGKRGGAPVTLRVPVHAVEQHEASGLASTWARQRIAELMLTPAYLRGRAPAVGRIEKQVIDLSLRHRVLTELTAFVAIDNVTHVDGKGTATTVVQGVDLAEGMAQEFSWGHVGPDASTHGSGGGSGSGSGYGSGAGRGFGGRGTRAPRIRQSQAQVMGSIDRHIIRRIVRAHLGEIRGCYNAALVRDPNAKGRVVVQFTIGKLGLVHVAAIQESEIDDAALGKCITSKVRKWKFPVSADASAAVVSYPFVLQPTDEAQGAVQSPGRASLAHTGE